jgi:hypothetical protein
VRSPSGDQHTRRRKARPVNIYKRVELYLDGKGSIHQARGVAELTSGKEKNWLLHFWRKWEAMKVTEKNISPRSKQDDNARVFGSLPKSVTTHGVEPPQRWRGEKRNQIEQEGEGRQNAPTKGRKDKGSTFQTHWRENVMTTMPS